MMWRRARACKPFRSSMSSKPRSPVASMRAASKCLRASPIFSSAAPRALLRDADRRVGRCDGAFRECDRGEGARQAGTLAGPDNTIQMLAFNDDIEVATPVLRLSERLDERALLANAGSWSQRHLFAIAQRTLLRGGHRHVAVPVFPM